MSLKSLLSRLFGKKSVKEEVVEKTHRPTYPTYPEVEKPVEKPEVEKMTERLKDVSSKPLTLVQEEKQSVKEIKAKSVKKTKSEPSAKPKKVAAKTTKSTKKEPKK